MKLISLLLIIIPLVSCLEGVKPDQNLEKTLNSNEVLSTDIQAILDSANVIGSILVYNVQNNNYYSNDFEWCKNGQLPASTFKITNSIIALETGVVQNDSTVFKWNGETRRNKNLEQDLTLKEAFHYSCLPCYQDIAKHIGVEKMKKYIELLEYGHIKVDSSTLENFWLIGNSHINQFEQIEFLKRLYESNLPISKRTETIMKRMIIQEENETFKISGKTGWSYTNKIDNGWFVGYVEVNKNIYYFATNITPKTGFDIHLFPAVRKAVTYDSFKVLGILH